MNVGSAIKKIKIEKNISQKELSVLTGISCTSLSQIEKGRKRPSEKSLRKICKALRIPEALVYFYGLEEKDIPAKNKQLYNTIYPALEEMIRKILIS